MLTASNGLCESRGPEGNKLAQPLRRQRLVSQSQVLLLVDSVRTSQGRPLLWPRLCLAQRLWSLTPGTQGLPCHWVFDKHRLWGQQVTDHKTFFLSPAVLVIIPLRNPPFNILCCTCLENHGVWTSGIGLKGLFGFLELSVCVVLEIEPRSFVHGRCALYSHGRGELIPDSFSQTSTHT